MRELALDDGGVGASAECTGLGAVFNPSSAASAPGDLTGATPLLGAGNGGAATMYSEADGLSLFGDAATSALGRALVIHGGATVASTPLLCGSLELQAIRTTTD